jgi:peptide/nickel transport system substrate-binding protein
MSDRPLRIVQAYAPTSYNQNFDPRRAMLRITWQVLEGATRYVGTGEDLKLEPWLTTGWKQTDAYTWRFTVRPGVTFTDGEPLTSEAFKATLDSIMAKKDGAYRPTLSNLSIKIVDDMTFDVVSTYPNQGSLPAQMSSMLIMPPKYLAQVGAEQFGQKPIGTGPYMVTSLVSGSSSTLEANPHYWGPTKPSIKTIQITGVGDASTRVSQLLAKSADLVDGVTTDLMSRLDGSVADVRTTPTVERTFLLINTKTGPTADVNVRKAINMAIDRDSIVKDLLNGQAFATQNMYVPLELGYDQSFAPWKYDPAAAKALVDAAGPAAKQPFVLGYTSDFAAHPAVAQAVQSELQAIGLNVKLQEGPISPFLATLKKSTTGGMGVWNFGPSYVDPAFMMSVYFTQGTAYAPLASDPKIDDLAKKGQETADPQQRETIYRQIQTIAMQDDAFWAPIYRNVDIWGASTSLNWSPSATGDYNLALASWKN